jgi:uncharacterized membrane protein
LSTQQIIQIVVASFSALILIVYHFIIGIVGFFKPHKLHVSLNIKTRKNWIMEVMFKPDKEPLMTQVLRNFIYGSTFLASLSSTLALFVLTQDTGVQTSNIFETLQLHLLAIFLFTSFSFFALSVRLIFHTEFLIIAKDMSHVETAIQNYFEKLTSPREETQRSIRETVVEIPGVGKLDKLRLKNCGKAKKNIALATVFFTIGVRGLMVSTPIASWMVFGEWGMLTNSICLVILFFFYDFV